MIILPVTYLGPVEWWARLAGGAAGGDVVVDVGERWVKQTARNRCEIMTAGGVRALVVPVHAGRPAGGGRVRTREVRVDNSKRWQHVHWGAIEAAYGSAPFFEHYAGRFEEVYRRKWEWLVDLDEELMGIVAGALKMPGGEWRRSEEWVEAGKGDEDLRGKKALRRESGRARMEDGVHGASYGAEYVQVFADRQEFVGGLSVLDLLMCEGPEAGEWLKKK